MQWDHTTHERCLFGNLSKRDLRDLSYLSRDYVFFRWHVEITKIRAVLKESFKKCVFFGRYLQRRGFSLIERKLSKLRGSELRRIWDVLGCLFNTLSAALYEASVLGFWNFPQWQNIWCSCATSRFQLDRPNIVEIMVSEIWDILGFLNKTETLRVYCDVVGTTLCGRYVRATVWKRRCEIYVVRKTLWERCREKDVVRKTKKSFVHVYRNKSGQRCENDVRKALWEWCENDIVSITSWEWWCEINFVSMTLWERLCEKDVMTKTLCERRWNSSQNTINLVLKEENIPRFW